MQEWANLALETARVRGASFADARVMDIRLRNLSTKNGQVGTLSEQESLGIGVRALADGSWGFASTDRLTREGVQACAARAVAIARASALAKRHEVVMAPEQAYVDTWQNPFIKDPFAIPLDRQLDCSWPPTARWPRKGRHRGGDLDGVPPHRAVVRLHDRLAHPSGQNDSGAGIVAMSFAGDEIQKRSYPASFGGQHQLGGYELVESLDLVGHAQRIAEEAVALHKAAPCPEGERTLILDSSQLGLQIHESIGHPIELDRVLGMEANFAGMSFLTLEKLRKLRYASDIVNVVADARLEHGPGLGTFAYDDEGVPAQCTDIIKTGLFTGYLTNRETAAAIGLGRSGGTMRGESWNRLPIIRMTNISLLPGTWNYDDSLRTRTTPSSWRPTAPGRSTTVATIFSFPPRSAGRSRAARKAA